jgi:hypothetical protein
MRSRAQVQARPRNLAIAGLHTNTWRMSLRMVDSAPACPYARTHAPPHPTPSSAPKTQNPTQTLNPKRLQEWLWDLRPLVCRVRPWLALVPSACAFPFLCSPPVLSSGAIFCDILHCSGAIRRPSVRVFACVTRSTGATPFPPSHSIMFALALVFSLLLRYLSLCLTLCACLLPLSRPAYVTMKRMMN